MRFEFATATRIIFGNGTFREVAPIAAEMGKSVFVITDTRINSAQSLFEQLKKHNIKYITHNAEGEPTTISAMEAVEQSRLADCDLVIGLGGGSVIDTGKVVAAMLTNSGKIEDYLEVVGLGKPLTETPAPYIAIPTTAGTGAEVTRNAVLAVEQHDIKVSMRSPLMLPRLAVVDPELTVSMPPAVTASTGLDALTQLMEAYVSNKANPLTDGICRRGLTHAARSLRKAYENGDDITAREDMSIASLFGGLALANAKLGAVHGFAGTLGGMFHAPHGVICASLLPAVMQANVQALQSRSPDSPALQRFDEIAQILTGSANARAKEAVEWINDICRALNVPSLADIGLKESDFDTVIQNAKNSSSMKGNPIMLSDEELMCILKQSL